MIPETTSFFGEEYSYVANIKTPQQLGMNKSGALVDLAKDIGSIIDYISVLVTGPSPALKHPTRPLGNKYFLKTIGKCTDQDGNTQSRSLYINNIPVGNIPILSEVAGTDFSTFRGILPGIIENVNVLNPVTLAESLMEGASPDCIKLTAPVVDGSGNAGTSSGYVTITDIKYMDPCAVSSTWEKPAIACGSGEFTPPCKCIESFDNIYSNIQDQNLHVNRCDMLKDIYYIIITIIGVYLFLSLLRKIR